MYINTERLRSLEDVLWPLLGPVDEFRGLANHAEYARPSAAGILQRADSVGNYNVPANTLCHSVRS